MPALPPHGSSERLFALTLELCTWLGCCSPDYRQPSTLPHALLIACLLGKQQALTSHLPLGPLVFQAMLGAIGHPVTILP